MKKKMNIILALLFLANVMQAQNSEEDKKNAEALNIMVGGSFAKPKIIPKLEKLALAQITVNYKLTTTQRTIGREKSSGAMAGAKLTAYLETTDGELGNNDFQEVTDYFYSYFQRKLKENGIDTVAWSKIAGTDFYKNAADKDDAKNKEEKSGNVWVTSTANKGNMMYGGGIPFAFGKIKKASRFSEEVGAPAGYFHLTVDFADIMVNVDIKTTDYISLSKTRTFKYDAAAKPEMRVVPSDLGVSLFWNEKTQSESLNITKDICIGY